MRASRLLVLLPLALLLTSCSPVVLYPAGDIAARQRDMLLIATGLMLLIIVPVIAATFFFAWRYRASNRKSPYAADWDHSTKLELLIWTAPLLIIVVLGAVTWVGTHLLDPYRPLDEITTSASVDTSQEPLVVEVVALNWKWLFLYPEYGVATVNELAAPVDRPIRFELTAESVMNAFYVPTLAGMIYAMPGMETKLHAVVNAAGVYDGFASHYNGAGFSNMRFKFHGLDDAGFEAWIEALKASETPLDRNAYLNLVKPSEADPVTYFSTIEDGLYQRIVGMCVPDGKLCMQDIATMNTGPGGQHHDIDLDALTYESHPIGDFDPDEAQGATAPASNRQPHSDAMRAGGKDTERDGGLAPAQLND
ncbi:ubiquinol oxidase subunit II [Fulvimarina sp. 2208YS6-2-32]|uniref:Ubiquinol oxidase subunit 2 n=1 Tax=Fulvimarina uroteuthidis TaxID=3098149 RepID=A0ABU5I549_9HYPH|nr:ubiquinol oxidase subunit II [Fulvimarina sp. 2208YS6-2-32]MDY8110217.1 ubiquinol oxidase subunit II [Fulvimarina sp. 2208YS6-2-32]